MKETARRLEEERKKKLNKAQAKIIINCLNEKNKKSNANQTEQHVLTDPSMKDDFTQTEEIFFKMHWSYFTGKYKILQCRKKPIISTSNFIGFTTTLFGQMRNRNAFINNSLMNNKRNRVADLNIKNNRFYGNINFNNNINAIKAKSLTKRMTLKNSNIIREPNAFINNMKNDNNSNSINNEEKNTIKSSDQNNIKVMKNQNMISSNPKIDMGKSQYSLLVYNKSQKKDLTNSYNKEENDNKSKYLKTSSPLSNPFPRKKKNTVINNYYYNINSNETNIKRNGTNISGNTNFYATKYNGFNKKKISKDNLKNKMAKTSMAFYKK
jgi:hypothetical protein